jgi:hypothetical protein
MKRFSSLVSAVCLALAVTLLPTRDAAAHGVQVAVLKISGKSLDAVFETADGCFVATTTIHYASQITQESGPPVRLALTQVELNYSNFCTQEFFDLTGGTTEQVANIAPNLSAATLTTVVPVTDGVISANVTIDARFTAVGAQQATKDHTITRDPGTITIERRVFMAQEADTTGTSITTVLPLAAGDTALELATDPVSAQMGRDVLGTRTITFLPHH